MSHAKLFDLSGRTALVTGGGTGLGRQFATTLAQAGATVVLASRRIDPLERTAAEIRAAGGSALCLAIDVGDTASVETALATLTKERGIDVLVNNAGAAGPGTLLDMAEETWDTVMDVNVKGAWRVARGVARDMIARGTQGSIINIASVLGTMVQKGTANYPIAKAALLHLTRAMAVEWARYGIRVNALVPGYFRTELSASYLDSDQGRKMLARMPIRRLGEPAELAGAVLLLASSASSYMTGSQITIDGGLSIPTT